MHKVYVCKAVSMYRAVGAAGREPERWVPLRAVRRGLPGRRGDCRCIDTLLCFVAGGAQGKLQFHQSPYSIAVSVPFGVVSPATTRSNPGPFPGNGGQLERARHVLIAYVSRLTQNVAR